MSDLHDAIWLEKTFVLVTLGLTVAACVAEAARRLVRTRQLDARRTGVGELELRSPHQVPERD